MCCGCRNAARGCGETLDSVPSSGDCVWALCIYKTNDATNGDDHFYSPEQVIGMRPWLVTLGHIFPENSNCLVMKKCHFMNHIETICQDLR